MRPRPRLSNGFRVAAERAFTVVEVLVGMFILALLTMALYSFVRANLSAVEGSTQITLDRAGTAGLIGYIQGVLNELPSPGDKQHDPNLVPLTTLQGVAKSDQTTPKGPKYETDTMQFLAGPGQSLLAADTGGTDYYYVTLAMRPVKKTGEWEIGIDRRKTDTQTEFGEWVPLLRPAAGLRIEYLDARLGGQHYQSAWNDKMAIPTLVRVTIWRRSGERPYRAVLPVIASKRP